MLAQNCHQLQAVLSGLKTAGNALPATPLLQHGSLRPICMPSARTQPEGAGLVAKACKQRAVAPSAVSTQLPSTVIQTENARIATSSGTPPDIYAHLCAALSGQTAEKEQVRKPGKKGRKPAFVQAALAREAKSFCINCCAPLPQPQPQPATDPASAAICKYCGHSAAEDEQLHLNTKWSLPHEIGAAYSSSKVQVAMAVDERMLMHRAMMPPYPERPERLQAIVGGLQSSGLLKRCHLVKSRKATDAELEAVHSRELIDLLAATASGVTLELAAALPAVASQDMLISADTHTAARLAAGCAAEVALTVARKEAASGLAIVRPPGHQASRDRAQGGCYFNNVAVAARAVQASGAAQKVLIVDWDVHHGQGTQDIFEEDNSVLYISLHRLDREFYPETGYADDSGTKNGLGYTINIARSQDSATDADYLSSMMHVVLPMAYEFQPDLILVSAGFDAAAGDQFGWCALSPECYAHMTHLLKAIAPVVLVLEGGYNLAATSAAVEACTRMLLGERPPRLPGPWKATQAGWIATMSAMQVSSQHDWSSVQPISLNGWASLLEQQQAFLSSGSETDE